MKLGLWNGQPIHVQHMILGILKRIFKTEKDQIILALLFGILIIPQKESRQQSFLTIVTQVW